MTFRFLHLADLHLESNFGGSPQTKTRLREAILDSFSDAIDLAIERQLDAVLCAGDLYDNERLSVGGAKHICDEVERLARAGVAFLWVCGNHDPGGPGLRAKDWLVGDLTAAGKGQDWHKLVHVFRDAAPEAVKVGSGGLVIGAGHQGDRESANLAASFPLLKDVDTAGRAVVGLLHTQVEGGTGEHERYAPSTAADFTERRYSYWALGHVHKRGRAVAGEPVWYCGNLMGRSPKPSETGLKGGLLVECEPGQAAEPSFVRLGRLGFERFVFDGGAPGCEGLAAARVARGIVDELAGLVKSAFMDREEEMLSCHQAALRIELSGPFAGYRLLSDKEQLDEIADDLAERLSCIEVQLRARGVVRPVERDDLEAVPTVLAQGLGLYRELLGSLESSSTVVEGLLEEAGISLAGMPVEAEERRRYLHGLLTGLDGELIDRLLVSEGGVDA